MSSTANSSLNRVLALLGTVLILATGVVLLTSSGGSSAALNPVAEPAAVDRVEIEEFLFAPEAVTVAVGSTITWTNRDSAPHTATSGAAAKPNGVFDTDIITKGQSKTVKLTKPGTFAYYCGLHPFMHGTLIVK